MEDPRLHREDHLPTGPAEIEVRLEQGVVTRGVRVTLPRQDARGNRKEV